MGEEPTQRRRLSHTEWLLIAMIGVGVLMVLLRWEYISTEVVRAVSSYFE